MVQLLLVEDNEMNRDMLSRRLRRRGFQVAVAGDGVEAIEAARTLRPALIVMDMSLPRMDGWAATRVLKSDPVMGRVPVIALTAHAMPGDRERALAAGCDAFDTKPVDIARLVGIIQYLLQQQEPAS
jgi:CheY-like chemotaxis protein